MSEVPARTPEGGVASEEHLPSSWSQRSTPLAWLRLLVKGMAMGTAEVVPGVSGGTIAFVAGIYNELVTTIARYSPASVVSLYRSPPAFMRTHNVAFLVTLAAGMGLGIVLFAQIIVALLESHPTLVWGFFLGIILASVVHVAGPRERRWLWTLAPVGALLGLMASFASPSEADPDSGYGLFFLGGAIAVCAWLLPAVSGSFVLLVMGLYAPVLVAIAGFDFAVLVPLALGCAVGLLLFARLLAWLVARYAEPLFSLLAGFMLGSSPKLWPWRGDAGVLTPDAYAGLTGTDPAVLATLLAILAGAIALWLLTRLQD